MKKLLMSILLFSGVAQAEYVNGYYRSNGTYVNGYHRSDANSNIYDNYSTQGNVNPYTGAYGTKSPNYYNYHNYNN